MCSSVLALSVPAVGADETRQFNITAQPLVSALKAFAEQANMQLLYKHEVVESATANTVVGKFEKHTALEQLLRGTGLEIVFTSDDNATIKAATKAKTNDRVAERISMTTTTDSTEAHPAATNDAARAPANEAKPSPASYISEVIVTAQRREEKLRDVPMGITALTGDNLERLQQNSFENYAALVPGLSVTQTGPGINRLTLRGLNAGGVGSTVAVYVDDSPFGSSSSLANAAIFAGNFDTWDMQRIEVLRGPQGMFYGASSEGGLIKFVTNAPLLGEFSSKFEAAGENVAEGSTGWSAKAVLNLPLGDRAALRVSGFTEDNPGYVDDPLRGKQDINHDDKNGARIGLLLTPTDTLTIRLTALAQDLKLFSNPIVDSDRNTRQPVFGSLTQKRTIQETTKFEYRSYNGTVAANLGWANLVSSTTYNTSTNGLFTDATLGPADATTTNGELFSAILGQPVNLAQTNRATVRKFTQELRLESLGDSDWEWQIGAFYTREKSDLFQPLFLFNPDDLARIGTLALTTLDSRYKEKAAFGSVTYNFSSQFDVQVGARWATNDQTGNASFTAELLGIPPTVLPGVSSADKFLYSVAPRWHVTDDLLVYGRVASGYESGGPNPLPPGTPGNFPLQFEPDSTVNYEIGVRSMLLDGRMSIDVTAFLIDWSDIQLNDVVDIPVLGSFGILANGGEAKSQGFEWTIDYIPFRDLTFTWVGAYIDARLTSAAPAVDAVDGQQLPGSPKWSSSLNVEYGWDAFADYRAFVGGIIAYTGAEVQNFHQGGDAALAPTRIPSYTTGSVRAGLQGDKWSFTLNVMNVTDKRALALFGDSGFDNFPSNAVYVQPRTIILSATRAF